MKRIALFLVTAALSLSAQQANAQEDSLMAKYQPNENNFQSNMTLVGQLVDPNNQLDEYLLVAYVGGEYRGVTKLLNNRFFLTIYGDTPNELISFLIVDEKGIELETSEMLAYQADDNHGTYETPYPFHIPTLSIDDVFASTSMPTIEWYDLQGRKVDDSRVHAGEVLVRISGDRRKKVWKVNW